MGNQSGMCNKESKFLFRICIANIRIVLKCAMRDWSMFCLLFQWTCCKGIIFLAGLHKHPSFSSEQNKVSTTLHSKKVGHNYEMLRVCSKTKFSGGMSWDGNVEVYRALDPLYLSTMVLQNDVEITGIQNQQLQEGIVGSTNKVDS